MNACVRSGTVRRDHLQTNGLKAQQTYAQVGEYPPPSAAVVRMSRTSEFLSDQALQQIESALGFADLRGGNPLVVEQKVRVGPAQALLSHEIADGDSYVIEEHIVELGVKIETNNRQNAD